MRQENFAARLKHLTSIDLAPGEDPAPKMADKLKELARKLIEFEDRFAREQPESKLWEDWALEVFNRLEICEKDALEEVFDIDAAQDRLGTIIEESLLTTTIPCADGLVMDSAKASVRSAADLMLQQAQQVGIMRSLTATRTASWLKAVATALRTACYEEKEGAG